MSQTNGWIGRRNLLKWSLATGLATGGSVAAAAIGIQPAFAKSVAKPVAKPDTPTPEAALEQLLAGNQRFAQQHPTHPDQSTGRMIEISQAQHPFATILSCADSRVAAELIFDQGLGDLFDVRVAGNIVLPGTLGSIEYAVVLLGTPLLMVLGHERCGAVTAAVQGEALPGSISAFVDPIKPVLKQIEGKLGDAIENAVVANVQYQVTQLRQSSLLAERVEAGTLKIVGGRYDLDTGKVTLVS
jgi:carbonic anhydrase